MCNDNYKRDLLGWLWDMKENFPSLEKKYFQSISDWPLTKFSSFFFKSNFFFLPSQQICILLKKKEILKIQVKREKNYFHKVALALK